MKILPLLIATALFNFVGCDSSSEPAADLPDSMKGTVLYAYQKGEQQVFVVMPGTNRQKSWQEIDADTSEIHEDGGFHLKVTSLKEAKDLISKVSSEYLFIGGVRESVTVDQADIPDSVTDASAETLKALEEHWASVQKQ